MLGSGNDLVLQFGGKITEIITVAGHPYDKISVFIWVILGINQGFSADHIKLNVMSIISKIGSYKTGQPVNPFLTLKQAGEEFKI